MAKLSNKVRTENLLLFTGMALMAAGPVFWYLMGMVMHVNRDAIGSEAVVFCNLTITGVALLLTLSGAAVSLSGFALSAWHTWMEVRPSTKTDGQ
ncbi:hypothetical protein [Klebsiella aerogenes]|uniref:hypothetical protein n=1 Tax=Klebsiella aerogenes TaxID=548 RepID=UPI000DA18E9B|nr:hypothetical protein [Klebsiella aerogenes]HCB2859836.1 hypothetical protein [Klebsiella aerogenes]HCB2864839.1 hypothetical protein [Klebsiella aerogenes]HCB2880489.1 hypothetical protein [Klebsiella aerogenes]HCB3345902.1 hypothetical protein [Klebsiella aerogenes]HCM1811904.1 hypothetical protein [Klebsiella aerogenes]